MEDFTTVLLNALITNGAEVIATLLVALLTVFGTMLLDKLGKNKKLENLKDATAQVITMTQQTVLELQQTLVENWKKNSENGKLTEEQIAELRKETLEKVTAKLSAATIKLLEASKSDLNAIIVGATEEYVYSLKKE